MKKTKKPISILLAIIMLLSITSGFSCSVLADTSSDFEYTVLDDGTAEITGYTGNATDLVIPSEIDGYTVTSIGVSAFEGCTSLTGVSFPDSLEIICGRAFAWCTALSYIDFPDKMVGIGTEAFRGTAVTEVTIPNGITDTAWAFSQCVNLKVLNIPASVTTIDLYSGDSPDSFQATGAMLSYLTSLTEINVSENNTVFSSIDGVLFNKDKTALLHYPLGKTNSNYTVPSGVKQIYASAFGNSYWTYTPHKFLKNLVLPEGVSQIENGAIYSSGTLESVTIPASVIYVGDNAITSVIYDYTGEENHTYFPVTIYGYEGTAAQLYAQDNESVGMTFAALNPVITDGTDTEYTIGSENGASIHCTYELANFINVAVDGNIVDKDSYTLAGGSTILTFNSDYLDTLEPGEHKVDLNYTNGTVSTMLTIIAVPVADKPATDTPDKPVANTGNPTTDAPKTDTAVNSDPENAKQKSSSQNNTSETSPSTGAPRIVFALAAVLVTGSAIIILRKKEKH